MLVGQVEPVDDRQAEAVERGDDGSSTGSAYGAVIRIDDVGGDHQRGQPAGVPDMLAGIVPSTPRPTAA